MLQYSLVTDVTGHMQFETRRCLSKPFVDCRCLQASTNTLLAHFLSVVFANCIIGVLSKAKGRPITG